MKQASPKKIRLDAALVERGLAESRQRAQAMILAGSVLVNGQKESKAGKAIAADARIELLGTPLPYVSRGGVKLRGALDDFAVDVRGKVCLDVGSSTGGFTDCLLQAGATRVHAVDVSTDQLAWKLRQDARVVRVEKNARLLRPADLPEQAAVVTVDLSFISTAKVLATLAPLARAGADWLILVKPQFELERREVGKGGIVRDPKLHEKAIARVAAAASQAGLTVLGVRPSRLPGAEGNQEYFLQARTPASGPQKPGVESPHEPEP
jgi:23S rRNA (cytidine1920-2'-O)/16S rRNA (cytidine1409-2'-O)-methyltransferase